jgi:hypothetical protein
LFAQHRYAFFMGRGVKRSIRGVTAMLALLAVAYYSFLLPGHLVSQFNAEVLAAEYGISAGAICSNSTRTAGVPKVPGAPAHSCPICKGLAAFHATIAPTPQAALPVPTEGAAIYGAPRDHLAEPYHLSPRSRGPPLQA